jgi:hypothetical protein
MEAGTPSSGASAPSAGINGAGNCAARVVTSGFAPMDEA